MEAIKKSIFYQELVELADEEYRQFSGKLTPNVLPERFLGVRIPLLRALAKRLLKTEGERVVQFLKDLPHGYYDENNLHGILLSEQKDFQKTIQHLEEFLPFVDNWATCDIMSPQAFKKQRRSKMPEGSEILLCHIRRWMGSDHEYTIRFGIEMLMTHYLGEEFQTEYLEWVTSIRREEYYVKMMIAWFFATALTKQYEHTLPYIEKGVLEYWTHNKAIQKARESRLIPEDRKVYLQSLRRKE